MSSPNLAMNFNVFDENAARQELQKAQEYINSLNSRLSVLGNNVESYVIYNIDQMSLVKIPVSSRYILLTATQLKDSLILLLPENPGEGQICTICAAECNITALSVQPNKGQIVSNAPLSMAMPDSFTLIWVGQKINTWFKL